MPAEWEPHRATWIAWPHHEPDWPGKLGPIPWVYAEIVRVLARHEPVEILCHDDAVSHERASCARRARRAGTIASVCTSSRPIACGFAIRRQRRPSIDDGSASCWSTGHSTAGRSTTTGDRTRSVGAAISRITGLRARRAASSRSGERIVLEGGGIDVNGDGLLLVTEEWLLSDVQVRNPGMTRAGLRARLRRVARRRHARSGWAKAALATTRTATSTTWRGSSRRRHDRARGRRGSARRQPRAIDGQPAAARACRRATVSRPLRIVHAALPAAGDHERRAAAGQLRELLHRQRRRPRADVQRPERPHRAEHAGIGDADRSASSASTPSISSGGSGRCTA